MMMVFFLGNGVVFAISLLLCLAIMSKRNKLLPFIAMLFYKKGSMPVL